MAFIFVSGDRLSHRPLGRVADFCPFCREFRPHRLLRVGTTRHIYYVPLGEGALLQHERECEVCRNRVVTDARTYRRVSENGRSDLTALIAETFPNIRDVNGWRIELEREVCDGTIRSAEREELIREPFLLLNPAVEARATAAHFDWVSSLTLVLSVVGVGLFIAFGRRIVDPAQISDAALLGGFVVIGILPTVIALASDVPRFMSRRIYPALLLALTPLRPTESELRAAQSHLRGLGMKIGRKINVRRLGRAMVNARQTDWNSSLTTHSAR